jgi:hypothetical protein
MKEDNMKNSQLKSITIVQIRTENAFILGYSIHQKAIGRSADFHCRAGQSEHRIFG